MKPLRPPGGTLSRAPTGLPPLSVAVAMSVLAAGVLAKVWRASLLWSEAHATEGFLWLPLGVASDLLVGAIMALAAWGTSRARKLGRARGVASIAVGVTAVVAHVGWQALNLVSFGLTQAPITFSRLRGEEGVRLAHRDLVSNAELIPAFTYAAVAAVAALLCLAGARRVAASVAPRFVQGVLLVSLVAYGFDAAVTRDRNFGAADNPVLTLASSLLWAYLDPPERPVRAADLSTVDADALQAAREPVMETPPLPRQRASMRNVIVFFAEGIARKHTSLDGTRGPLWNTTPHLATRARRDGLELTRYYSPYHKSIAALYSFLCSDYPPPSGRTIVELNPRIDCGELSDVLSSNGFHNGFFHGGEFGFYDKLMLIGDRGWDRLEDATSLWNPIAHDTNEWGIDDRVVVDAALAWVDELPVGDRFAAVLVPITAHWPYWIPPDVATVEQGLSMTARFRDAVRFSDETFERLMRGLEERGLAEDTAVIFLADHGETVGEAPRASAGRRLAYEPSVHVPFVILAPGMWAGATQSSRLVSHVDLVPTILDLLGLPTDARHHGISALEPDRAPRRIFLGAHNGPRWIGWLDGTKKVLVNRSSGAREVYDLAADPDERHNLVDELPPADTEVRVQDALAFADATMRRLKLAPRKSEEIDIEQAFLAAASVRVVPATSGSGEHDAPQACVPVQDASGPRRCGDDETLFTGRKVVLARGWGMDCVVVAPPVRGALEIEVSGQSWLPLLSRLYATQTDSAREDGKQETQGVEVWVDDEPFTSAVTHPGETVRLTFPSPKRSLRYRVVGGEAPAAHDLCLAITDRGYHNRPLTKPAPVQPGNQGAAAPAP